MRIVCQQTILMNIMPYLLFLKKQQNLKLSSAANYHLHQRRFRRIYLSTNPSPHDPQNLLLAQTNRPMKTPGRNFSIFPSCQSG